MTWYGSTWHQSIKQSQLARPKNNRDDTMLHIGSVLGHTGFIMLAIIVEISFFSSPHSLSNMSQLNNDSLVTVRVLDYSIVSWIIVLTLRRWWTNVAKQCPLESRSCLEVELSWGTITNNFKLTRRSLYLIDSRIWPHGLHVASSSLQLCNDVCAESSSAIQ